MSLSDELQKLQQLRQNGALSEEEFAQAKARLLGEPQPAVNADQLSAVPSAMPALSDSAYLEKEARQWGMFLHLSIFAGYVIPLGGLIVPIVIWQLKKNELPGIDAHGKNAVNWIISHIIYVVLCVLLILAVIGIPLLVALGIISIIFPIVAALKANSGEVWKYPLAIPFFS